MARQTTCQCTMGKRHYDKAEHMPICLVIVSLPTMVLGIDKADHVPIPSTMGRDTMQGIVSLPHGARNWHVVCQCHSVHMPIPSTMVLGHYGKADHMPIPSTMGKRHYDKADHMVPIPRGRDTMADHVPICLVICANSSPWC